MTALSAVALERLLEESGALRSGHFELSSGRHAVRYLQCALLLELPSRARRVGEALAARLAPHRPDRQARLPPRLTGRAGIRRLSSGPDQAAEDRSQPRALR